VEDLELYVDEEEEAEEAEGANRTFIILVAAMGGLLALGICAFVAWALWLSPQRRADLEARNQAIQATNTAMVAEAEGAVEETAPAEEAAETEEATSVPTNTPVPAATERPTTAAPESATTEAEEATEAAVTETPAEMAQAPTATPRPSPTRRPTATPRAGSEQVPDTGIGALSAGLLAMGLLFLLIVVRRMRRAM